MTARSVPPVPGGAVGAAVVFVPASRQSPLLAAFAQDEITAPEEGHI